jgi:hypothetical protein
MSVVDSILLLVATCLLLIRFCFCCGISRCRFNLGLVLRNPTPVGHPMGDRLVSKSRQRFRISNLWVNILLIEMGTSVRDRRFQTCTTLWTFVNMFS